MMKKNKTLRAVQLAFLSGCLIQNQIVFAQATDSSANGKGTPLLDASLNDFIVQDLMSTDGVTKIYDSLSPAITSYIEKKRDASQSILEREFDKAKIEIPIEIPSLKIGGLEVTISGQRTVTQTKQGEQRRIDQLVVEAKASNKAFAGVRFSLYSAKYFTAADIPANSKHSLKYTALWSKPIRTIPRSSQRVLDVMKVRESLSVEIDGSFGLEFDKSKRVKSEKSNAGISIARGATFVLDVSRPTETKVNVRLMGLKNRGELSASVGGSFSLIPNAVSFIANQFSVGGKVNVNITDRLLNRYPVESMLLGYTIDSNSELGKVALDSLFSAMGRLDFIPLFTVGTGDEKLSTELLGKLKMIEDMSDQYANQKNAPVRRLVRAKMMTQNFKAGAELLATKFVRNNISRGGAKTYIRYFDPVTKVLKPYVIWNEYYQEDLKGKVGGITLLEAKDERVSLDFLAHSDMNKAMVKPIGLITSIEGRQSKLTADETGQFRNRVLSMIPQYIRANSDLERLLPTSSQHSVFYRVDSIITNAGLQHIAKMDEPNLNQAIIDFANANKIDSKLTSNQTGNESRPSLADVTGPMARNLIELSSGKSDDMSRNFSEIGRTEEFIRQIGPNLLPTLLPIDESVNKMSAVNVEFDSSAVSLRKRIGNINENNEFQLGDQDAIEVFKIVRRLRSILTDRGFEERLANDMEAELDAKSGK